MKKNIALYIKRKGDGKLSVTEVEVETFGEFKEEDIEREIIDFSEESIDQLLDILSNGRKTIKIDGKMNIYRISHKGIFENYDILKERLVGEKLTSLEIVFK